MSTETPVHVVSSFDHFVTQWMSTVTVSAGSARNSSHGHDTGSSTAPWIVKLHSSSGVCGVGPAESTGKSRVTYWPGGTRAGIDVRAGGPGSLVRCAAWAEHGRASVDRQSELVINRYAIALDWCHRRTDW